jgi:hypothetical protein
MTVAKARTTLRIAPTGLRKRTNASAPTAAKPTTTSFVGTLGIVS